MEAQLQDQFQQLQSSLQALLTSLEGISEAKLQEKPAPDKWSVLEIMHHVMAAEKGATAYIGKKLQHLEDRKPSKSGFAELLRSTLLLGFLKLPLKVKSPESLAVFPDDLTFADLQAEWLGIRQTMEEIFDRIPKETLELSLFKHPIAGRLSLYQGINFLQGHFDRHQKQIQAILSV